MSKCISLATSWYPSYPLLPAQPSDPYQPIHPKTSYSLFIYLLLFDLFWLNSAVQCTAVYQAMCISTAVWYGSVPGYVYINCCLCWEEKVFRMYYSWTGGGRQVIRECLPKQWLHVLSKGWLFCDPGKHATFFPEYQTHELCLAFWTSDSKLTLEEPYSSLGIPCWHLNWNSVTGIWNSFPQRMRLRRSVTLLCKTKRMKNCKTVLKAFHQFLRIEQSGNEVVLGGRTFQLSIKSSLFPNTLKPLLLLFLRIPIINGQPLCVFWL